MGTIEHRRLFRAAVSLKILFETAESPAARGVLLTTNMSSSGCHAFGSHSFQLGEQIKLKVLLKDESQSLSILAEVIWQKKCEYSPPSHTPYYAVGIRFLDISPQDAILASDFIYETLKKKSEQEEQEIILELEKISLPPLDC